jgi:CarboxypepD_reg-like domain
MRFFRLTLLCFLCPIMTWAQGQSISGKIVRADTKSPVAGANVFFSNSSYGTTTNSNGTFTLNNVRPGQYTLVISHLGYTDFVETILVSKESITRNIELVPKSIVLRGVTITTGADWKRNFEQFKKEFIGVDENAKYCEIMNPQILDFTYYSTQKVLLAAADQFLIVENKALGYRVKFLIDTFRSDGINRIITFGGKRLFEELPGNKAQQKKWRVARNISFYGSTMHFLRALYQDRLMEEGFEMHRYVRYVNPNRPPEDVILRNMDRFRLQGKVDSFNKWVEIARMSKYYHEMYYPEPSFISQVLRKGPQPGLFVFSFPDCMCIQYTKKQDPTNYGIYLPLNVPNYETTIISFMGRENGCVFDMNGIVVAGAPLYEGTWSKSRLSQLLPVDFQPTPEDMPAESVLLKKQ